MVCSKGDKKLRKSFIFNYSTKNAKITKKIKSNQQSIFDLLKLNCNFFLFQERSYSSFNFYFFQLSIFKNRKPLFFFFANVLFKKNSKQKTKFERTFKIIHHFRIYFAFQSKTKWLFKQTVIFHHFILSTFRPFKVIELQNFNWKWI